MFNESKYIIVPKCLINDNEEHIEEILPLFCFLQIRKGIDDICMVSLKGLLEECGYTYENTRRQQFVNKIIAALHVLQQQHYIFRFIDADERDITDVSNLGMKDIFFIETNPTVMNFTGNNGFIKLAVDVYKKIKHVAKKTNTSYWRSLYLYLHLFSRMYHYGDRKKYIGSTGLKDFIKTNPEYYRTSIDRICSDIKNIISINTIKKIIKIFNENNILMSRSIKHTYPNVNGNPTVRNLGTIFVQYSDYWQIEMDAAIADTKENFNNYIH